jgi:hypothetical protein
MSSTRAVSVPAVEPVSVSDVQDYLKIPETRDVDMITGLIIAARTYAESVTGRSLASKDYVMTLDRFPYFSDVNISTDIGLDSSYARYSTLWNYSQMIKLRHSPVTQVEKITYIGVDGFPHDIFPGVDFLVDYVSEDCRLFTLPGSYWPVILYVPDSVTIFYTAGYDPDPTKIITINATDEEGSPAVPTPLPDPPNQQLDVTLSIGIPVQTQLAIKMLACHWYLNREPVSAGMVGTVPNHVDALLASSMVFDYSLGRA